MNALALVADVYFPAEYASGSTPLECVGGTCASEYRDVITPGIPFTEPKHVDVVIGWTGVCPPDAQDTTATLVIVR